MIDDGMALLEICRRKNIKLIFRRGKNYYDPSDKTIYYDNMASLKHEIEHAVAGNLLTIILPDIKETFRSPKIFFANFWRFAEYDEKKKQIIILPANIAAFLIFLTISWLIIAFLRTFV